MNNLISFTILIEFVSCEDEKISTIQNKIIEIIAENGCFMRKIIIEASNPKNKDSIESKKNIDADSLNVIDKGVRISKIR